jgi:ribosomal protein S14
MQVAQMDYHQLAMQPVALLEAEIAKSGRDAPVTGGQLLDYAAKAASVNAQIAMRTTANMFGRFEASMSQMTTAICSLTTVVQSSNNNNMDNMAAIGELTARMNGFENNARQYASRQSAMCARVSRVRKSYASYSLCRLCFKPWEPSVCLRPSAHETASRMFNQVNELQVMRPVSPKPPPVPAVQPQQQPAGGGAAQVDSEERVRRKRPRARERVRERAPRTRRLRHDMTKVQSLGEFVL